MNNKIRVLLIDDYPTFALREAKNAPFKSILRKNQLKKQIPLIVPKEIIDNELDESESEWSPQKVTVQSTVEENYSDYFELKWLRNYKDVYRYKKMCQQVEDTFSPNELGSINGVVPEIVLFDYALTGHENKSILDNKNDKNIIEKIIPNRKLASFLKKKGIEKIEDPKPFELNVKEIKPDLNNDNLGCIGGIIVVSQFRNHPCIGIATTRKNSEDIKGQEAQFLEILNEEPEQFNFDIRGDITNLNWKKLLSESVDLLRDRIKVLTKSGKVIPDPNQLIDLSNGNLTSRVLSLESDYGFRDLPLDGLFIDKKVEEYTPETDEELPRDINSFRDYKIWNFSKKLLNLVDPEEHFPEAKKTSKVLLNAYKSDEVNKRINLSLLLVKHFKNEISSDEKELLKDLKEHFGINNDQLRAFEDGNTSQAAIQNMIKDFRNEKAWGNNQLNRLIVLFTKIRLHKLYQEFVENNSTGGLNNNFSKILKEPPTFSDLLFALFPVPKYPLVLPYHWSSLPEYINKPDSEILTKSLRDLNLIEKNKSFPANLTAGEKILCKGFAMSLKVHKPYLPTWLN